MNEENDMLHNCKYHLKAESSKTRTEGKLLEITEYRDTRLAGGRERKLIVTVNHVSGASELRDDESSGMITTTIGLEI